MWSPAVSVALGLIASVAATRPNTQTIINTLNTTYGIQVGKGQLGATLATTSYSSQSSCPHLVGALAIHTIFFIFFPHFIITFSFPSLYKYMLRQFYQPLTLWR